MKCSLGVSKFLKETSSLSPSIVFLFFFALITEEGFLISPCYSLELCIQRGVSFLSPLPFTFHFHALDKKMATHLCSCLENPGYGGAWWAAVYGVTQSRT